MLGINVSYEEFLNIINEKMNKKIDLSGLGIYELGDIMIEARVGIIFHNFLPMKEYFKNWLSLNYGILPRLINYFNVEKYIMNNAGKEFDIYFIVKTWDYRIALLWKNAEWDKFERALETYLLTKKTVKRKM